MSNNNPHRFVNFLSMNVVGGTYSSTNYKGNLHSSRLDSFASATGGSASEVKQSGKAQPIYKLVGYLEKQAGGPKQLTAADVGKQFRDGDNDLITILLVDPTLQKQYQVVGKFGDALFFYDVNGHAYDEDGDRMSSLDLALPAGADEVKFVPVEV